VIQINKAGYIYIVLTIAIGFSAVNTANNLLYIVTSTLLSYMLVSGIFGRKNLRGIDIALEFPKERFAGSTVPVGVKLINRRRFMPAFLIRVLVGSEEVLFTMVSARSSSMLYLNMVFEERGKHTVSGITMASIFPFNFFTRYRRLTRNLELIVYPRLQSSHLKPLPANRTKWRGDASSDLSGYDSDLLSIRDYVFGDAMKYISWKATAKTGRLKTKELSTTESPNIMIDFNRLEKQNLEHTLSCIAYVVVTFIHAGTAVGLAIDGDTYPPSRSAAHKTLLLTRLALYGQD
jgi:uncharacterized protein (DUF58 family)